MFDHLYKNELMNKALLKDTEKQHPSSLLSNILMDKRETEFQVSVVIHRESWTEVFYSWDVC